MTEIKPIITTTTQQAQGTKPAQTPAQGQNLDIGNALTNNSQQVAAGDDEPTKLTQKEAKKWIEDYMAQNNCSKSDAKAAFKKEFGKEISLIDIRRFIDSDGHEGKFKISNSEEMRHKDAMKGVNDYMQENNCSKKEAKQAFEHKFGYNIPRTTFDKVVNTGMSILSKTMTITREYVQKQTPEE